MIGLAAIGVAAAQVVPVVGRFRHRRS